MYAAHDQAAGLPFGMHARDAKTIRKIISYSEWDNEESIQKYRRSADHQEIKRHNENITGAKVAVKLYEEVS